MNKNNTNQNSNSQPFNKGYGVNKDGYSPSQSQQETQIIPPSSGSGETGGGSEKK